LWYQWNGFSAPWRMRMETSLLDDKGNGRTIPSKRTQKYQGLSDSDRIGIEFAIRVGHRA
jgi:hypothetical protein